MNETPTEEYINCVSDEFYEGGTVFHEGKSDDSQGLESDVESVEMNRVGKGNYVCVERRNNVKKGSIKQVNNQ